MEGLNRENATHVLRCRHVLGRNVTEYYMPCHVLKTLKGNRAKILVFGDRFWQTKEYLCRIRYVDADRLVKLTTAKQDGK